MLAAALCSLLLAIAPQVGGGGEMKSRSAQGVTLQYENLSDKDADAILSSIKVAKDMLADTFSIHVNIDPIVTLRERPGARKLYWTDGDDKIFFDFPSNDYYFFAQVSDERIIRFALPAITQLWLSRWLTSTAGLDPRIIDSITEYAEFAYKTYLNPVPGKDPPQPPTGPGRVWYQLEQVYGGTPKFLLNTLTTQKVAGHLLGEFLRETAFAATDDENVKRLFDALSPPVPLLATKDLEPGPLPRPRQPATPPANQATPPANPATNTPAPAPADDTILRCSRVATFNGVPLLDTIGPPITAAERLLDFDHVFDMAIRLEPDGAVSEPPPTVRGIDVWKLYFEFRSRVVRARDDVDYLLVLREFLARFTDSSMKVGTGPKSPVPPGTPLWSSVFGISFVQNGTGIYVKKITADSAPEKAGIKPGTELLAINGEPAARTLETLTEFVTTFESQSSPQRAKAFALANLLCGPDGGEVEVTLGPRKDAAEAGPTTVKLRRGLPPPQKPRNTVDATLRPDGIGVITVARFDGDALARFAAAVDDFAAKNAKGIVIDVRGNEGLRDATVKSMPTSIAALIRLLPKDMPKTAIAREVMRSSTPDGFAKPVVNEIVLQAAPGSGSFAGPIAVLVDAWTGGEAELFAVGVAATKRGLVVGSRTSGSASVAKGYERIQTLDKSRVTLIYPNSAMIRLSGDPVLGVGIAPNVEVEASPTDLAAGKDTVLEKAIEKLR